MTSPRNLVLAAYRSGAATRREIVAVTQLDPDLVDLIVDTLIRSTELDLHSLRGSCGSGGCRGCLQSQGCVPRKDFSSGPISLGLPVIPS